MTVIITFSNCIYRAKVKVVSQSWVRTFKHDIQAPYSKIWQRKVLKVSWTKQKDSFGNQFESSGSIPWENEKSLRRIRKETKNTASKEL